MWSKYGSLASYPLYWERVVCGWNDMWLKDCNVFDYNISDRAVNRSK